MTREDMESLDYLIEWMQRKGVMRAKVGDIEIHRVNDFIQPNELESTTDGSLALDEELTTVRNREYGSAYDDPDLYPSGVDPIHPDGIKDNSHKSNAKKSDDA